MASSLERSIFDVNMRWEIEMELEHYPGRPGLNFYVNIETASAIFM